MPNAPLDGYLYVPDRSGNGMGAVDIPAKVLPVYKGGTGLDHYEVGDLLTADTPITLTRLDAEPVGKVLISQGEDVMPVWGGVPITGYSGTLPPINGGTGTGVLFTQGSIVFAGPGGAYAQDNLGLNYNDAFNTVGMGAAATPETRMRISANITGATIAYGTLVDGTVLSDVTATAAGFITGIKTQATPFTLGLLAHFYATQPAFGAGSVVTSQVGFSAGASLGGGVNNFGFFGDVPVGPNNYNFYANSNAKNLFKGPTSVGADPVAPMEVATKQYVDMKTAGSIALMTKGSVPFGDASGSLIQDNANLYFDDALNALGVGAIPTTGYKLRIGGAFSGGGGAFFYGVRAEGIIQTDVTTNAGYFRTDAQLAPGAALTNLFHYQAVQGSMGAGSTVGTQVGFQVTPGLGANSTLTLGFDAQLPAGSGKYNLYMQGTADNYIAGRLGIGAAPAGSSKVLVAGNSTGSSGFGYGTITQQIVQSDLTVEYASFVSVSTTQAAAFTLPALIHFKAQQSAIQAPSVVTTQIGFKVDAGMLGATSNYAFFGDIPAGPNRYNFFAPGTAQNCFAGFTRIGSTAPPTVALDVTGTIQATQYVLGSRLIAIPNPTVEWSIDLAPNQTSPNYIALANNATFDLPTGAGFLMLFDNFGGGACMCMCVYGGVVIMIQNAADYTTIAGTVGKINVFYNAGTNRYRVQNMKGSTSNLFVGSIRMRDNP